MKTNQFLKSINIQPKSSGKTINAQPRHYVIVTSLLVFVFVISLITVLLVSFSSIKMTVNTLPPAQQIEGITTQSSRTTKNGIIFNSNLPGTKFNTYNKTISKTANDFVKQISKNSPETVQIDVSYSCYFSMHRFLSTKLDATALDKNDTIISNATKALVYDIVNDRFVNITDVLSNEADAYVAISEAIANNLKNCKDIDINNDTIKANITASPNTFSDFIFTDDAIHFVYSENILASDEIIVSCELDEINNEINPEFFPDDTTVGVFALPEPTTATVNTQNKQQNKTVKTKIKSKSIALTFDDGPNSKNTKRLLKTLKKYGVKSTFFVLGSLAKQNPKLIKKAYKNGHEIAIHSWSHKQYTKMKPKQIRRDIRKCKRILKNILGSDYTARSIRVPYGSYNDKVLKVCKKEKLSVYMWSLDTLDWKYLNKKRNIRYVSKKTKKKDIILMHDIHKSTVASIKDIIINLSKKGYEFVRVSDLIAKPKSGKVYFSGR